MKFWLITVNYGDPTPTVNLINSIKNCIVKPKIKVAIADNSSTEGSIKKLNSLKTSINLDIALFPFNKNRFYWSAAKRVIQKMVATHGGPPD